MTSRVLAYIIRDQKPLVLPAEGTVQEACRRMWERHSGSVLLTDDRLRLVGIFTGRDAVRLLAKGDGGVQLTQAMTFNPVTIAPKSRAVDALRAMAEGGFRHVPVIEDGVIKGVVSCGDIKGMEFEAFRRQQGDRSASPEADFRALAEIVKGQKPLVAGEEETVGRGCQGMRRRRCGSLLVVDGQRRLSGIFTGRDAVRLLATSEGPAVLPLKQAMTRNLVTLGPADSAIDALRAMSDGGFRHIPVVEGGKILGVVSRNDFTGVEIDRLDEEEHLQEVIW
jgi:CBS domain-containing protein